MIKRILVLSEEKVEKLILEKERPRFLVDEWALISISSEGESKILVVTKEQFKSIGCSIQLFLKFGDFGKSEFAEYKKAHSIDDSYLFNEDHAQKILDFVKHLDLHVRFLIVQCSAGKSRSGAVGLFLSRYLGLDEKEYRELNSLIVPNEHVLSVLMQKSGLRDDYEKFWNDHA